jgi:hypothetical protein
MVSRHEFETIASTHHEGQKLRKTSRWSQFVALAFAQLSLPMILTSHFHRCPLKLLMTTDFNLTTKITTEQ